MKSPFPGMDPCLERRWSDVHSKLITYVGETLQPILPKDLRARTAERVLLQTLEEEEIGSYRGDVTVIRSGKPKAAAATTTGAGVISSVEPVFVDVGSAPEIDSFVQIIDASSGNRVITAIEILSPWNKGPGRLN